MGFTTHLNNHMLKYNQNNKLVQIVHRKGIAGAMFSRCRFAFQATVGSPLPLLAHAQYTKLSTHIVHAYPCVPSGKQVQQDLQSVWRMNKAVTANVTDIPRFTSLA